MSFLRSWGYAKDRPLTSYQEQRLNDLLDQYHEVQHKNFVDELDVTEAVIGRAVPFSELTVEEANKIAAHLNVRIALHTHFRDTLPSPPPSFAEETKWLNADRTLLDRVIARAGWDTGEYFLSPHPLDKV
ncbi:MAG: hypothetical protein M1294_07920 [Firmicutes bacterium]|jgi:L-ascorbate metabolism protein UlaG (beta-lactamase superfamily)|uniref:Uncharacterized protein n=1 Tax=Sulfobacillus benefaciens TaxID=453960 RepID=A0A2T2X8A2_9FIRM|nr:hypothetical protein [Bacillota bacterium]MCL5012550.1 hypothetical protein [Bacillota bacterium]PSR30678.1 MAG: hypothetical protein C7B43_05150 [Sulfobacillus benefaciens]HBQ94014.1 hypothetical protein [Sulfobacillus sp.]